MVIKIHGLKAATCTQGVLATLEEKGVDYELVPIDLRTGQHKTPEYLKLHPFGKIPVLEHDGFFLYESRAICNYISRVYASQGTKLTPDVNDLKAYALYEQASSVERSYFHESASKIAFEKIFKMWRGGVTDEAVVAAEAEKLDEVFKGYEAILSKQPYLAGQEITLADMLHVPYGRKIREIGYKYLFEKYPHVEKWYLNVEGRDSWKKVLSE
ncbi:Glutathione S-transferase hmp2 [Erysiphe neolycopersici]|uniref:glutathione transferase n=1 Tax=Erysiphe neolycopersici TaxID=212602 RepID=A0A420H949_9PEZI|nr:Glutathione S-transferase hmp2 [Erysiphe neolycopersici]